MIKKILIGVVALVVIGGVGVYYLYSNLGGIIKAGVERYGSEATQAKVTVDSVTLSLTSGQGEIKNMVIGNPTGFNGPSAFDLGSISLSVDTASVTQNPVVVREVIISGPRIAYERSLTGGGNLEKIQDNVAKYASSVSGGSSGSGSTPSSSSAPSSSSGPASPQPERKVIIENLVVRGGQVAISTTQLQGRTVSAALPEIRLRDIGKDKGGATPAEVAQRVIGAIAQESIKVAANNLGGLADQLKSGIPLPGQGQSGGGNVGDQLKGLFGK